MKAREFFLGRGMVGAVVLVASFSLAGCGGGGGGGGGSDDTSTTSSTSPSTTTSGRPAPTSTPVGRSVDALSSAIGVESATRVSGNIPGAGASSRSLDYRMSDAERRRKEKRDAVLPQRKIADTQNNREAIQGAWTDNGEQDGGTVEWELGWYISGDQVYQVRYDPTEAVGNVCEVWGPDDPTTLRIDELLDEVDSITSDTMVMWDGDVLQRDTSGNIESCALGAGGSSGGGTAPELTTTVGQVSFSDNSTFAFNFTSSQQPTGLFIQLEGADEYFVIPGSDLDANGTQYTVDFFGPTPAEGVELVIDELIQGTIIIQAFYGSASEEELVQASFTGSDDSSNWSPSTYVDCIGQPARSGALQYSLTWDTDADLDLYVVEPDGTEIWYGSAFRLDYSGETSPAGGTLDVDDTDGYGPENIFYQSSPPAGTYTGWVEHFSGTLPTNYTLTVTQGGQSNTFTGTLTSQSEKGPDRNVTVQ